MDNNSEIYKQYGRIKNNSELKNKRRTIINKTRIQHKKFEEKK